MSQWMQQSLQSDSLAFTTGTVAILVRIAIAMVDINKSFYTRQIDAAEAAAMEHSRQLKLLLKKSGEISAALEQWSGLLQVDMESWTERSNAWRQLMLDTMSDMREMSGSSRAVSVALGQGAGKIADALPVDRRFMATMISFPERRRAAPTAMDYPAYPAAPVYGTASVRRRA